MHLIGINGLKTSGKDTTYKVVRNLYGNGDANVLRVAFADKLKTMGALALGYGGSNDDLIRLMDDFKSTGWVESDSGVGTRKTISGRAYLQAFGGRAREVFGDTFWIDQVLPAPTEAEWHANGNGLEWVADRYPDADCVCVTDVRYPNEAERIKALGGVVWEVVRPGLEGDGHDTEIPLPRNLVDWTIHNSGDLAHLEGEVYQAMEETLR